MSQATTGSPDSVVRMQLRAFEPVNDGETPDQIFPFEQLERVELAERIQGTKDSATFTFEAQHGELSDMIEPGYRIGLYEAVGEGGEYGAGNYGEGYYGGDWRHRWTGLARGLTFDRVGPKRTSLTIEATDFAFGVCDFRTVFDAFENTAIAGTPNAIVNTLVRENAPELTLSRVGNISEPTDVFFDGRTLLDALLDLARRSDCILASDGRGIVFVRDTELTSLGTLTGRDMGVHSVRVNDDHLVNDLRVTGGSDYAPDQTQENVESFPLVTDDPSTRLSFPIQARKSSYPRIEIWTRRVSDSDATMRVRLQNDRNGAPVAPDDTSSDITRQELPYHFISNDDFTTFILPEHTLPPGERIWVLVDTDREDGHRVGVNSEETPAYRAHYPYTISVELDRPDSIDTYRRRQGVANRENINTFNAARDFGRSILRHSDEPRREISFRAQSETTHSANPAEAYTVAFPWEDAQGDYIITEKNMTWEANTRETTLVGQEAGTL